MRGAPCWWRRRVRLLRALARTLKADFDYHGICLINARGESSIGKIAQLMRRFHVPAVCFYDRDVMDGKKPSPMCSIQMPSVTRWMWWMRAWR